MISSSCYQSVGSWLGSRHDNEVINELLAKVKREKNTHRAWMYYYFWSIKREGKKTWSLQPTSDMATWFTDSTWWHNVWNSSVISKTDDKRNCQQWAVYSETAIKEECPALMRRSRRMHSHTLARTLNRHECLAGLYRLEICHLRNKTTCLSDVYLHLTPRHTYTKTHTRTFSQALSTQSSLSYFSGISTTFPFFFLWAPELSVGQLAKSYSCSSDRGAESRSLDCAGFATHFMNSTSIRNGTEKSQFTLGYLRKVASTLGSDI